MKSKEILKTLLLILLILSMVVASVQLLIFRNLPTDARGDFETSLRTVLKSMGLNELANMLPKQTGSLDPYDYSSRFAFPTSVTYNAQDAPLSTAYNMDSTLKSYTDLKETIAEVLSAPYTETDLENWNTLCGREGSVILDFGRELSLQLFLQISGKNCPEEFAAIRFRYLILWETDGGTNAILKCADERFLQFDSSASYGQKFSSYFSSLSSIGDIQKVSLIGRADSLEGRTVAQKYEKGGKLEKQLVFPSEEGRAPETCFVQNPIYQEKTGFQERYIENILTAFSYNPANITPYPENDGTEVYVESYSNIRIAPSGTVTFQVSEDTSGLPLVELIGGTTPDKYSVSDVLYAAQALIGKLRPEIMGGDAATLRFEEAYYDPEQEALIVGFDYVIDGVRVTLLDDEGRHIRAVTLAYRNGYFVEGEINTRAYMLTGPTPKRMNILQMAQVLSMSGVDYSIMEIRYVDTFTDEENSITPGYYSVG